MLSPPKAAVLAKCFCDEMNHDIAGKQRGAILIEP